ncbi:MAG TPA: hypothetical protein VEZ47_04955, partial [Gemmatirosa sp.]|nr:hypothetical protein [Gemmatirosa sp.]
MSEPRARYGWESDFPAFRDAEPARVREAVRALTTNASRLIESRDPRPGSRSTYGCAYRNWH